MTAIKSIRKSILRLSQAELARITGTTQATVCRWELGESAPDLVQLTAIRIAVQERGHAWNDSWFFDGAPEPAAS